MKVIFLDFDGVLNGDMFTSQAVGYGVLIDDTRLQIIKRIVDETGAKIVLSTSWKMHWSQNASECNEEGRKINDAFARNGLFVFDKTPTYRSGRKAEVIGWLNTHRDVIDFAVIDDHPFEEGILVNHFVLTSGLRYGISEDDADKAIKILNGNGGNQIDLQYAPE